MLFANERLDEFHHLKYRVLSFLWKLLSLGYTVDSGNKKLSIWQEKKYFKSFVLRKQRNGISNNIQMKAEIWKKIICGVNIIPCG